MDRTKPLIFLDPHPRTPEMIYDPTMAKSLSEIGHVEFFFGARAPNEIVERWLPEISILIGQTAMGAERLARAKKLKAIINVKANWEPNIDYREAHRRGIHVLSSAPAMAPAVAEWSLAAALDLGRGLTSADHKVRECCEAYGISGCRESKTMFDASLGLIGYGNLGRALKPLLAKFSDSILVTDPLLSDEYLITEGMKSVELPELLSKSDFLFILAGATVDNPAFLSAEMISLIRRDCVVVLASRAEVVDYRSLIMAAEKGKIRLALDVHPIEPIPENDPVRQSKSILISSHRAGADPRSYKLKRAMVLDDLRQILAGHRPMRLQAADPIRSARDISR